MSDLKRYFNSYVKELEDYRDLSKNEFYLKHLDYSLWKKISDLFKEQTEVLIEEEFTDLYILENVWDEEWVDQLIKEYFDPLEIIRYKTGDNEYQYIEITLTCWWPNIYLNINTRWNSYEYEWHWGGEHIKENISYLSDTIDELYYVWDY